MVYAITWNFCVMRNIGIAVKDDMYLSSKALFLFQF